MRRETGRKKKGFTLIEVIVTLTILGIIAAIAIPTGIQYMEKARQTARDKVARSVFLAAQKSLTSRMSSGNSLPVTDAEAVDVNQITGQDYKDLEANKKNIVYLSLNQKDKDEKDKELFKMLEPYLADLEILDNTVLIEFNKKTGKVYTAFYSEVVSSIGYEGSNSTTSYNAYKRSEQDRKDGKMGYWGVDSTGAAGESGDDDSEANIQLVDYDLPNKSFDSEKEARDVKGNNINDGKNYGLLTVECLLPENMISVQTLTIQLESANGTPEDITIVNDDDQTTAKGDAKLSELREKGTLDNAIKNPVKKGTGKDQVSYPMYVETRESDNRSILVLVLDSPLNGLSIMQNHEALGTGDFVGHLLVKMQDDSTKVYNAPDGGTNKANVLFGATKAQDGDTAYAISSVRHLNNIRYMPSAKEGEKPDSAKQTIFVQTENVYCRNYDGRPLSWNPIGVQGPTETYSRGYKNGSADEKEKKYTWAKTNGFAGTYMGEKKTIYDLTIDGFTVGDDGNDKEYGMAGLFSSLSADGIVEGVELNYTAAYERDYNNSENKDVYFIHGKDRTGGIAGENWGVISQCTVQGNFYSDEGEARVGGIVGKNMWDKTERNSGLITQCVAVVNVTASGTSSKLETEGACAGGIVGDNYGAVTYCESGTATSLNQGQNHAVIRIDRTPYFGITKKTNAGFQGNYESSANDVVTITSKWCAGGIAGQNRASEWGKAALIQYCVNASKVVTTGTKTMDSKDDAGAGGIVGRYCRISKTAEDLYNGTEISYCYNAGTVTGSMYAGGISGTYKENGEGKLQKNYNVIQSCYNTGKITNGTNISRIGGVLGCVGPFTKLSDCYNVGAVGAGSADKHADGIFFNRYGSSVWERCAARKGTDPETLKVSGDTERNFLENWSDVEFEGMTYEESATVGLFKYPYPHLNVTTNNDVCKLGTNFHRTPYK